MSRTSEETNSFTSHGNNMKIQKSCNYIKKKKYKARSVLESPFDSVITSFQKLSSSRRSK